MEIPYEPSSTTLKNYVRTMKLMIKQRLKSLFIQNDENLFLSRVLRDYTLLYRSVCSSVHPSVSPSVHHTLLILGFCGLWPHSSSFCLSLTASKIHQIQFPNPDVGFSIFILFTALYCYDEDGMRS